MRVIITGAAGFIGSHLAERFLAEGHEVIGVDNLITGKEENLKELQSPRFKFVRADVSRDNFDPGIPVEGILHFGSPASPEDFTRIPLEIMDANSLGCRKCLDIAMKYRARFMMASTSEVYGDPLIHPQSENYYGHVNPRGPRSVYDESKRFAEAMTYAYRRKYGAHVRVVRIFNTYGPRMRKDDGRVIPNFITQALENKPLTIYGDGTQSRSFCYISDQIEGIYKLFMSDYPHPVNIGNDTEYTILELVEIMKKVIGRPLKVEYRKLPENDPTRRQPDISLARQILGWKPTIGLEKGLKATINWFRKKMQQNIPEEKH